MEHVKNTLKNILTEQTPHPVCHNELAMTIALQVQWFGDSPAKIAGSCECRGSKEFDEDSIGCELSTGWWMHVIFIASGVTLALGLLCTIFVVKFTHKYGSGICERIVVLPN